MHLTNFTEVNNVTILKQSNVFYMEWLLKHAVYLSAGKRQRRREEQPLQDGLADGDELSADNLSVTSSASDTRSILVDGMP